MALAVYGLASGISLAEDVYSLLETEERLLLLGEEFAITPTKTFRSVKKNPSIVTVIDKQQIKNMGAQTLADVLRNVPGIGITIMRYGKYEIEVRGIKTVNSEKVLFMIDGHKVEFPISGGSTWVFDDVIVDNIERIEIVRGPGSALYGTGAFLATINLITQKPKDVNGVRVEARGGSFDTWGGNVLFGKNVGDLGILMNVDYLDTDGPRLHVEEDFAGLMGQPSEAPGNTTRWQEKWDTSLNLEYKDIYWRNRYVKKERGAYIGIVSALGDDSKIDVQHWFSVLGLKHSITPKLEVKTEGYIDYTEFDIFWEIFPEGFMGLYPEGMLGNILGKDQTLGADIQLNYELFEQNLLTLGWNIEQIKQYGIEHIANFDPNTLAPLGSLQKAPNFNKNVKRDISALYIQDSWNITEDISLTAGGRLDHYSDFGSTLNPRCGLTWQISEPLGLKLLYGKAFRAASFEQLYNINNPSQLGHKDLKPEKISTYEAELSYSIIPPVTLRLNYFNNRIEDLIGIETLPNGVLQFENEEGITKIDGIEVELRGKMEAGHYGYINYTYINPRDQEGQRIPDVPLHRGNVGINLALSKYINSNTSIYMAGKRYRSEEDTRDALGGYTLVNQSIILKNLLDNFELQATIYNLFNKRYADPAPANTVRDDYPRPGTSYLVEARYLF